MIQIQATNSRPLTQIRAAKFFFFFFFFFKNLASSITRYHGQVSTCKISEKANDLILRIFSEVRTDGQID